MEKRKVNWKILGIIGTMLIIFNFILIQTGSVKNTFITWYGAQVYLHNILVNFAGDMFILYALWELAFKPLTYGITEWFFYIIDNIKNKVKK